MTESTGGDGEGGGERGRTGDHGDDEGGTGHVQFLAPITGLLSIVFAVMAGASLPYALSRPAVMLLVPAGLAASSVGCVVLKRRLQADEGAGDEDGGSD